MLSATYRYSVIPFVTTRSQRLASGDPRLSLEERYPNFSAYYYKVTAAMGDFVAHRWELPEDAAGDVNRMLVSGIATGGIKLDRLYKELVEKGALTPSAQPGDGAGSGDTGAMIEGARAASLAK